MTEESSSKRIAWFLPDFGVGSGGVRTVLQNASYLADNGFVCDLFINDDEEKNDYYKEIIKNNYCINNIKNIITGDCHNEEDYDLAIATYYETANRIANMNIKRKLYFVQDYEPWFFPMSEEFLNAQSSYKKGLPVVTIGKWLRKYLHDKYGLCTNSFSFCADKDTYKDLGKKREKSICFIYQPSKPRRCAKLGLKALQIVQTKRPDIKVYLYGSEKMIPHNINAEHLGMLSAEECNELYNKCSVGLCLSSSNPSRIPFEMMMAGLPVVDLYLENNIYDFPGDGCLLAEPTPEAIATAILKLFDDDSLRKSFAFGGKTYMKKYPLDYGFKQFLECVKGLMDGGENKAKAVHRTYRQGAIESSIGDIESKEEVFFEEIKEDPPKVKLSFSKRVYLKIRHLLLGR